LISFVEFFRTFKLYVGDCFTCFIVGSSPDEALVHLLAGLENDGYQGERSRMPSPCHLFEHIKNPQNSDDEENEPQIEKEEMELSLVMSQRWDNNIEEHCAKKR
jgi:DNA polymerase zeta